MTIDEHNATLESLRTCTEESERARLLVTLQQDYTGVLTERDTALENAEKEKLTASNYAKLNNDLWLESTNIKPNVTIGQANVDNTINNTQPKKLSYADLEAKILNDFNKGGR